MPEPLPQTNRAANLTVALTHLVQERLSAGFAPSGLIGRIRPTFRIYENGQPSDAWQNEGIVFSDATDNNWNAATGYKSQGGVTTPEIQGTFGANESAWLLKPLFVRIKDFPQDELWTVRNVPVAGSPPILQTNPSVEFKGFKLTLQNSGTIGPARFPNSIVVSVSPPRETIRVTLVKAEDHQGRTVRPQSWGHRPDYGQYYWNVNIPYDATAIDFTFAIQAARSVEFLAKQTIINGSPGPGPVNALGAGLR